MLGALEGCGSGVEGTTVCGAIVTLRRCNNQAHGISR